jgi:hypothetical protein
MVNMLHLAGNGVTVMTGMVYRRGMAQLPTEQPINPTITINRYSASSNSCTQANDRQQQSRALTVNTHTVRIA